MRKFTFSILVMLLYCLNGQIHAHVEVEIQNSLSSRVILYYRLQTIYRGHGAGMRTDLDSVVMEAKSSKNINIPDLTEDELRKANAAKTEVYKLLGICDAMRLTDQHHMENHGAAILSKIDQGLANEISTPLLKLIDEFANVTIPHLIQPFIRFKGLSIPVCKIEYGTSLTTKIILRSKPDAASPSREKIIVGCKRVY